MFKSAQLESDRHDWANNWGCFGRYFNWGVYWIRIVKERVHRLVQLAVSLLLPPTTTLAPLLYDGRMRPGAPAMPNFPRSFATVMYMWNTLLTFYCRLIEWCVIIEPIFLHTDYVSIHLRLFIGLSFLLPLPFSCSSYFNYIDGTWTFKALLALPGCLRTRCPIVHGFQWL